MFKVTLNEDYKDKTPSDHYLTITEGKFKDVAFSFGQLEFMGEDKEGNGQVNFDYTLLYLPEHIETNNDDALYDELEGVIAGILHQILIDVTSRDNNETGNANTEQPAE